LADKAVDPEPMHKAWPKAQAKILIKYSKIGISPDEQDA